MLRYINNRQAQAVVGEYALVIFMVLGMVVAMTVYFKRGIQARTRDTLHYMVNEVKYGAAGNYYGNLYLHYEPYYIETDAAVDRSARHVTSLSGGQSSGIFQKTIDESTTMTVSSETAPPKDFDLTTPGP